MKSLYDFIIFFIVVCTCFGIFGGAFQVNRILAILLLPGLIPLLYKKGFTYAMTISQLLLLIYLFMAASFICTPDREEGVKELFYYIVHFVLFLELIVFARNARNPLKNISRGWLVAVLLTSIVAFWEITTGNHLSYAKDQGDAFNTGSAIIERMTASVTFANYNSYVTYLCFCYPWILYIFIDKSRSLLEELLASVALISASLVIIINASIINLVP